MKKYTVKFWKKSVTTGEFEVVGVTDVFDSGKIPLVAKAFLQAPNVESRGATKLTFE